MPSKIPTRRVSPVLHQGRCTEHGGVAREIGADVDQCTRKADNDRDEPPEWWEEEYPWTGGQDERRYYDGSEVAG